MTEPAQCRILDVRAEQIAGRDSAASYFVRRSGAYS